MSVKCDDGVVLFHRRQAVELEPFRNHHKGEIFVFFINSVNSFGDFNQRIVCEHLLCFLLQKINRNLMLRRSCGGPVKEKPLDGMNIADSRISLNNEGSQVCWCNSLQACMMYQ